jgi:3-hydroxyacyl-CoA dehydrogenase/enoyl-CoA hydratase/3-hydroxybutyryl-CoA epimerase/enoyl-CoA isomerase
MIYTGKALSARTLPSGIAQVVFDLEDSSVNKFDQNSLMELKAAVASLQFANIRGVIFSSAKSNFIVGADIKEFVGKFEQDEKQITDWLIEANAIFNTIEDMKVPTVTTINGVALGGGFELAIATDYRIATEKAVVGFPEVKLGILPGFGGTVRLPRLIGADNANQWISSGVHIRAAQALNEGAVDAIVEDELLQEAAIDLIEQCTAGKLDYNQIRVQKTSPLTLTPVGLTVAFDSAKAVVAAKAGPHYPAPLTAVQSMHDAATLARDGALQIEHSAFVKLAKTEVAANLVQMFLNDQFLAGCAKKQMSAAAAVNLAGVLGAGIMGGGIACQSALKGTPILMKDVAQEGIDLGMSEAKKLLAKRVARGRMDGEKMIAILSNITPTLDYDGFDQADIVVEAIVENTAVKHLVLTELEGVVNSNAIIASNTSTISIDTLAEPLQRPEQFCGMHFFNPVAAMPLVEVIRGEKSSDKTIATVVAYAKKMGKTPIVVNNCPGFLVNRILFPYFGAFSQLIRDGANFRQIDKAMERFGWPMGPAYLLDVIGMDTAVHCQRVMAAGFDRMALGFESAIDALYDKQQLGQKTGSGFYRYEIDKKGKPIKLENPHIDELIATAQNTEREFADQEIVERMMIALCLESVRCLEDGIVATPIEADMALVLGLGFPPFRGGPLRYLDSLGLAQFCKLAEKYGDLGPIYTVTDKLRHMSDNGASFYL